MIVSEIFNVVNEYVLQNKEHTLILCDQALKSGDVLQLYYYEGCAAVFMQMHQFMLGFQSRIWWIYYKLAAYTETIKAMLHDLTPKTDMDKRLFVIYINTLLSLKALKIVTRRNIAYIKRKERYAAKHDSSTLIYYAAMLAVWRDLYCLLHGLQFKQIEKPQPDQSMMHQ
jgi:hypothetical protein